MEVNREVAVKVLQVVDAGLVRGQGNPVPGEMCVEAAVCYAMGLPHGDDPVCVSRPLRALKIRLNDCDWSSNAARAAGLRRLAIAQLGSRDVLDDAEFFRRIVDLAIRKWTPAALRSAAACHPNPDHQKALIEAAERCEKDGDKAAAYAAADAAYAAADAARAAAYAADAAADAARAAAYAARAAAYAAAYAARAAYAAGAADAARAAAYAADAAADAADAAAYAAYAARDKALAGFAEDVVQVLIEMKAPGCEWLDLAPLAEAA